MTRRTAANKHFHEAGNSKCFDVLARRMTKITYYTVSFPDPFNDAHSENWEFLPSNTAALCRRSHASFAENVYTFILATQDKLKCTTEFYTVYYFRQDVTVFVSFLVVLGSIPCSLHQAEYQTGRKRNSIFHVALSLFMPFHFYGRVL